jgi:tRNA nucleotidyltransferase (CCA-adding enzyme)
MSINDAFEIISQLHQSRYKAYIVGGVVRDRLLGRELRDIDIATSALPHDVIRIFETTIPVGIEHGTVIVRWKGESYEVTTFRTDGDYEDHRHPSQVAFHDSIEMDLARRDFTMNAMALGQDGTILDPYNGQSDIQQSLIRAVGEPSERFQEDPLRMMRAIRFVSVLGFTIETSTEQALIMHAPELEKVSTERIRDEFEKLLTGEYCQNALYLIEKTNVNQYFPGEGTDRMMKGFIEKDWGMLGDLLERWTAFAFSLEEIDLRRWLKAWKLPNGKSIKIKTLFELVGCGDEIHSDWSLYVHGWGMVSSALNVRSFLDEVHSTKEAEKELRNKYEALPIHHRQELVVDGNELQNIVGRDAGPWIGKLMDEVERNVVEGKLENDRKVMKEWVQQWHQRQGKN